jgi:uncharacterized protein YegP (UPF0339 family)
MPTRYEYDLDANNEWRWYAIAESGEVSAVSPTGYERLQDCMHAVGLMLAPADLTVVPATPAPADPPEQSLSRLRRP